MRNHSTVSRAERHSSRAWRIGPPSHRLPHQRSVPAKCRPRKGRRYNPLPSTPAQLTRSDGRCGGDAGRAARAGHAGGERAVRSRSPANQRRTALAGLPTEQNGIPRIVKEEKGPSPTFVLPPGNYVVNVGFGLANVTKALQVRAETMKDVFEIPAGGLRIEGRVGDAKIPPGQISFDLYKGSQFEPGDKRPLATSVMTGDVVLVPEGTYHIVSNYGDANATVRSDIRVQVGKLTDTRSIIARRSSRSSW
jgi:hypothetical protein